MIGFCLGENFYTPHKMEFSNEKGSNLLPTVGYSSFIYKKLIVFW